MISVAHTVAAARVRRVAAHELPAPLVVLLALVVTAGCSWTDDGRTTDAADRAGVRAGESSPDHNHTDVAFAHEMTAHDQQALFLVEVATVRDIAPEIGTFSRASETGPILG